MEQQDLPQTAGPSGDHQAAPGMKAKEEDMKEEEMDVEDCKAALHGDDEENKSAVCRNQSRPPVAVESLLSQPFAQRSSAEKMDILTRGRPTPDLSLTNHLDKEILRFDSTHYNSKPWLTGCPKANKLFCWPCLLFFTETSIWTTGFSDLKNLQRDALEHERTLQHIDSQVQVCTYSHARHRRLEPGSKRARLTMDELYNVKPDSDKEESESSEPEEKLTDEISQNPDKFRHFILKILSRTIAVMASGSQESLIDDQVYYDEDEDEDEFLRPTRSFLTLVKITVFPFRMMSRTTDRVLSILAAHHVHQPRELLQFLPPRLDISCLLSSLTLRHQKNLIESLGEAFLEEIKMEMKDSSFVALILYETPIHSFDDHELATIVRYVTKDGFAVERFLGYTPGKLETTEGLTDHVFTLLQKMDCGDKMVAVSYAGQVVTSSHISGHVAQVKEQYPWVNIVNWYVSETSAELADASGMRECFFRSLNSIGVFFTTYYSVDRVRVLEEIISKRGHSSSAPLRWTKKSDLVKTVKEQRESLIELNSMVEDWHDPFDRNVMYESWGLEDLKDPQFMFLLEVFSAIFSCTGKFVNGLRGMLLKTGSAAKTLKKTLEALKAMHGDFDAIFSQGLKQADDPTQTGKWEESSRDEFHQQYARVLDAATSELAMRFESLAKLTFTELLNVSRFQVYNKSFPEDAFNCLKDSYGKFFDLPLLHNELEVVYLSPELKKKDFHELVAVLRLTGLSSILPQVSKLCELIEVLPLGSTKKQRGLGAIARRMLVYANLATMDGDEDGRTMKGRTPALALLAIERKVFRQVSKSRRFHQRAVHLFDQKEPRIKLTFR